jgi:signal transduction histidine kinase
MNEEVKEKMFTSFYSTKGHRGTGLGLLVTHKLVEEHGGRIEVTTQVGQGTTVTVWLPYHDEAPKA